MKQGETYRINRGPLAGFKAILKRHDNSNRAWYAEVNGELVFVYDYELLVEIKRPARRKKK